MPNSQIYRVFLLRGATTENASPLFTFKKDPLQRPVVGNVIVHPLTLERFKILKDEIDPTHDPLTRFTDGGLQRVTDDGDIRVTVEQISLDSLSHSYFVTPDNNPNRISSYTTAGFANDQTLKQLFR